MFHKTSPPPSSASTDISDINLHTKVSSNKGEYRKTHLLVILLFPSFSISIKSFSRLDKLFKVNYILSTGPLYFLDPPDHVEVRAGEQAWLHCEFRSSSLPVANCWIYNKDKVGMLLDVPSGC